MLALCLAALGAARPGALAQTLYHVTDLGRITTVGVGNGGMVAGHNGETSCAWDVGHGFTLIPGIDGPAYTVAQDVNGSGQVVGYDDSTPTRQAFIWDRVRGTRAVADFGTVVGKKARSEAYGVNGLGHVVGRYLSPDGIFDSFLWSPGAGWHKLQRPEPGYGTEAFRVNDQDEAVGTTHGQLQGVYWRSDGTSLEMGNLLSQYENNPYDINGLSHVCGWTWGPLGDVAYFWADGVYTPIFNPIRRDFYMSGNAINDSDLMVGSMYRDYYTPSAFQWTADGGVVQLNSLLNESGQGWDLQEAIGVNNPGQITGYGRHNGQYAAFLLTPVVPEPPAILVLAPLAALIVLRRRGKGN